MKENEVKQLLEHYLIKIKQFEKNKNMEIIKDIKTSLEFELYLINKKEV